MDVVLVSRVGRVGGVRTLEQRCLLTKHESQRWRLLFTMQVGLLRAMQFVQRSSPVKVCYLSGRAGSRWGLYTNKGRGDAPLSWGQPRMRTSCDRLWPEVARSQCHGARGWRLVAR